MKSLFLDKKLNRAFFKWTFFSKYVKIASKNKYWYFSEAVNYFKLLKLFFLNTVYAVQQYMCTNKMASNLTFVEISRTLDIFWSIMNTEFNIKYIYVKCISTTQSIWLPIYMSQTKLSVYNILRTFCIIIHRLSKSIWTL